MTNWGHSEMAFWCPRCKQELNFGERCRCGKSKPVDPIVITVLDIVKMLQRG